MLLPIMHEFHSGPGIFPLDPRILNKIAESAIDAILEVDSTGFFSLPKNRHQIL